MTATVHELKVICPIDGMTYTAVFTGVEAKITRNGYRIGEARWDRDWGLVDRFLAEWFPENVWRDVCDQIERKYEIEVLGRISDC